jgi:putative intracellular protease/amidase
MNLKNKNLRNAKNPKRVAIVVANPSVSTTGRWPVGFWWSELSHPYFALSERGYEIKVFSPNGGKCEADALSDPRDPSGFEASDLISMGFLHTPQLMELVEKTNKVSEIDVNRFDAILVVGGQGPMYTFDKAFQLH